MAERPLVIALNGPPGVGKDTLADFLCSRNKGQFTQLSIKEPLLEMACKDPQYGSIISQVWAPGAHHMLKDIPVTVDNRETLTPRAMLIDIATRLRSQYGDGYFARKAVEKILAMDTAKQVFIITDVGFECELKELEMHCDVVLVHMSRIQYTFDNDSRSYLSRPNTIYLHNDSTIASLASQFSEKFRQKL